ncbi:MAG: AAA family ATPase, partial [Clostridium sp.]|nr:AAA family ATPase [Clostridium sp.]
MFTRVKIKNYKSLINLDVDLSAKKKQPKPLVVIYGENGVGKSNFATAFCTLCESLRTMLARTKLQKLIDKDKLEGLIYDEEFIKFIAENLKDTESIIKSCKTINSTENMSLEFEFVIEGRQGRYLIEYDDSKIVHEKLEYVLNKNRTLFFEIAEDKIKINEKIFTDGEYLKYFYDLLEKYNGKHSFLSILMFEDEGKADGYVIQRISERLYEVLLSFMLMSVRVKSAFGLERGFGASCYKVFKNLGEG